MPRSCGWCMSPQHFAWERRVHAGESLAVVAASTPFSISAAQRHIRAHVLADALPDLYISSTVRPSDFVDRLLALSDQAAQVRAFAAETHQPRLLLTAIREESWILGQILGKLGIDSTDTLALIRDVESLSRAVAALVDESVIDQNATRKLSIRIREFGGSDQLATALESLAARQTQLKESS